MTSSKIVSRIAMLRAKANLTQSELASLLQVTAGTIANWEKSRVSLESMAIVSKLCNIFECSPGDLIEYVEDVEFSSRKAYKNRKLEEIRQRLNTNNSQAIDSQATLENEEGMHES